MEVNTRFEPQQASCQLEAPTIVWFSASIKHFIVLLLHVLGQQKRERFVVPDRQVRPGGNTISMFVLLWLVVNDRKFSVKIVFFFYTN